MKKRNIKAILLAPVISTLLYSGCISTSGINNNIFTAKESKVLSVTAENEILIETDKISCFDSLNIAEELMQGRNEKSAVINVIHKDDKNLQFRKEVALHDDGHLELTIKMKVFPSIENTASNKISYSFQIPAKVLNGMKFKAVCGKAFKCKPLEGQFTENSKILQCRYVIFEDEKKSFTFDFNPAGPYSSMDYPMVGEPTGYWDIANEGQYVNFTLACAVRYYGTVFTGKVFIYKGAYDFAQKHSQKHWCYSTNNSETGFFRQFTFGTPAVIKMFEKADCSKYSPEKKWGWTKTDALGIVRSDRSAITDNCVSSQNGTANEFIMDAPTGVYVLTLRCGHNTLKTGPFNISINGKNAAENIEIPAGETKTIDFTEYLKAPEKQIRIGFSGKSTWAVRSIIAQAVIFQNEDFSVARKLWVMDKLFSPDIEYKK